MNSRLTVKKTIFALFMMLSLVTGTGASAGALQQNIPSLAPMLEKVMPAVVSIRVSKSVSNNEQYSFNGQEIPEELRRFFNFQFGDEQPFAPNGAPRQSLGSGSGVIIDANAGYIATNHHVIDRADEITVTLNDGRNYIASLIGSDASTDIALLRIEAADLLALPLADSDSTRIGDFVVAIGNPFGIGQTVTSGIVSALGRAGLNNDNYEDFIQTDAAINMGNSGGALVDLEGRLVGMNTAIISSSGGGSNGIGFAVPANMINTVVEHLVRDGEVRRGVLGVQISNLTPDIAQSLNLDLKQGALVTNVLPDSAAEAAGIQVYDVIVDVDGSPVTSSRDLRNYIGLTRRDAKVEIGLIRDGSRLNLSTTVGVANGDSSPASERGTSRRDFSGAQLRSIQPGSNQYVQSGVEVTELVQQSRAWQAGLRQGDVITEVNRRAVGDLAEFNAMVDEAEGIIAFTVLRENRRMMILMP